MQTSSRRAITDVHVSDARRWSAPDTFDLSGDTAGHVGFGMGTHQCVGRHVRLAAEPLMTAPARRVRTIELGPAERHHNDTLRA